MKFNARKFLLLGLLYGISTLFIAHAHAAVFSIVVDKSTLSVGDKLAADINIDSEGKSINAAQATIKFPADFLEANSVDKTGSIFGFWIDEPAFSNQAGDIKFTGGATTGFSGKTLHVLRVNFTVKGTGKGKIDFTDGAITASDGSGTNVASSLQGAELQSLAKTGTTPVSPGVQPSGDVSGGQSTAVSPGVQPSAVSPSGQPAVAPVQVTPPVQIKRPAVIVEKLPVLPEVEVPFYPDPTKWYSFSSNFVVSWVLPNDVSDVATLIDHNPKSDPTKSEGLFGSKSFSRLDDGVWYLHVRFKNNVAWGPTLHYKLAVDTAPPIPYDIKSAEGTSTDFPQPTISYKTGDALSGVDHYLIKVDGSDVQNTVETEYKLPPQKPGKHSIRVQAVDKASNSTEKILDIEIVPIASPVIESVVKEVFSGEGGIAANGTALHTIHINIFVKDTADGLVYSTTVPSDKNGSWAVHVSQPFKNGVYYISAVAEDARGAMSLEVNSDNFAVKERPLLTVGGVGITSTWFYAGLIFILVSGFGIGLTYERRKNVRRSERIMIVDRDVNNAFEILKGDIDKLTGVFEDNKFDEVWRAEMSHYIKNMVENVSKMRKYLVENIEEIND